MMNLEMVDPWGQVVRECEARNVNQRSVAMTYAFGLRQEPGATAAIKQANEAIIKRWSLRGLVRVKDLAWAYHEGRREFGT